MKKIILLILGIFFINLASATIDVYCSLEPAYVDTCHTVAGGSLSASTTYQIIAQGKTYNAYSFTQAMQTSNYSEPYSITTDATNKTIWCNFTKPSGANAYDFFLRPNSENTTDWYGRKVGSITTTYTNNEITVTSLPSRNTVVNPWTLNYASDFPYGWSAQTSDGKYPDSEILKTGLIYVNISGVDVDYGAEDIYDEVISQCSPQISAYYDGYDFFLWGGIIIAEDTTGSLSFTNGDIYIVNGVQNYAEDDGFEINFGNYNSNGYTEDGVMLLMTGFYSKWDSKGVSFNNVYLNKEMVPRTFSLFHINPTNNLMVGAKGIRNTLSNGANIEAENLTVNAGRITNCYHSGEISNFNLEWGSCNIWYIAYKPEYRDSYFNDDSYNFKMNGLSDSTLETPNFYDCNFAINGTKTNYNIPAVNWNNAYIHNASVYNSIDNLVVSFPNGTLTENANITLKDSSGNIIFSELTDVNGTIEKKDIKRMVMEHNLTTGVCDTITNPDNCAILHNKNPLRLEINITDGSGTDLI